MRRRLSVPTPFSTALVLVVAAAFSPAASGESATLRVTPPVDAVYPFEMKQVQTSRITMGMMGSQESVTTTITDLTQKVVESSDAGATFEIVYDRVRMEMAMGGRTISMDTDEEVDPSTGQPRTFDDMIGQPFRMEVSELGRVESVTGFDAIVEQSIEQLEPSAQSEAAAEAMRDMFGNDAIADMFQQNTPILPENPVSVGSTWEFVSDISNQMLGDMRVSHAYEAKAFETRSDRECVRIDVTYVMDPRGEVPLFARLKQQLGAQDGEVEFDTQLGKSSGNATIWVDRETGITVAMEGSSAFTMTMTMRQPGQDASAPQMDMNIEVDADQSFTLKD